MLDKKKLLLVLMITFMLSPLAQGGYSWTVYPPGANFVQGYWDNSAGSTGSKSDDEMYFNVLRDAGGDDDELYYVSDALLDLTYVSFIKVQWERTSTCNGNATFGVSTVKNTNTFTDSVRIQGCSLTGFLPLSGLLMSV